MILLVVVKELVRMSGDEDCKRTCLLFASVGGMWLGYWYPKVDLPWSSSRTGVVDSFPEIPRTVGCYAYPLEYVYVCVNICYICNVVSKYVI